MGLLLDLRSRPTNLSLASRFTICNGIFYLCFGAVMICWPSILQVALFDPEFLGHESTLVRVLGMTLAVIGWLYIFGGRSGGRQFVAATVLNRLILVPLVIIPAALSGVFPNTFLLFGILDPLLGGVAWYLLSR